MLRVLAALLVALYANGASADDDASNREAHLGHILCARTVAVSFDAFFDACQLEEEKDVQENIKRNIGTFDNFIQENFGISLDKIKPQKGDLNDELIRIRSSLGNNGFQNLCIQRLDHIRENGIITKINKEITERDLRVMSKITIPSCF
ncbi:hypothetical protein [Azospirillum brasilense]|uniref:hypothetical protein n=1 Tax=Azospirillum brasilense TaxID=192 RepID=UPI001ED9FB91|nr:hypothetical protein [Azospirillum brasilense]UKJ73960.1 hypothetical protein H1Q64_05010 [Azospirillum brasilense]